MEKRKITTQAEARQYAIDWQNYVSTHDIAYGDLDEWYGTFSDLAIEFDLKD